MTLRELFVFDGFEDRFEAHVAAVGTGCAETFELFVLMLDRRVQPLTFGQHVEDPRDHPLALGSLLFRVEREVGAELAELLTSFEGLERNLRANEREQNPKHARSLAAAVRQGSFRSFHR
mgnify:CR=1 FL=1